MSNCSQCGCSLEVGAKICQSCGAKLTITPPPLRTPKAPKIIESEDLSFQKNDTLNIPPKNNFILWKVSLFFIVALTSYWFWSSKQAEELAAIKEARHVEEIQKIKAEAEAQAKKIAKAAQIKADEERKVLAEKAEQLRIEKEAALEAKKAAEEARKAHEEARKAQTILAEEQKAKLLKDKQAALERERLNLIQKQQNNSKQAAPSSFAQQQQAPAEQISDSQSKGHKAKFKGALGITIAKRYYPTEAMRDQALEMWGAKGVILEPDGSITNPNESKASTLFQH
jgi:cell division protein FtsI/penicillin-binding protein 2